VASVGTIASASSGVATFPVVVEVTGASTAVHAGATANVAIAYRTLDNVIVVPSIAVTRGTAGASVIVVANGKHVRRAVTTGLASGARVQITSGLAAGDEIVVPTVRRSAAGTETRAGNGTGLGGSGVNGNGLFPGRFANAP
jgi:macrolide-specific efflux system membrane fusion protein